ncbi:MAG: Methylmalonyl-CoA mutase [uncultured Thermomicrobiales bacterium]|uniref:Methylmalonyl-CoA mutase n=1 Tax=uncultured Thermomicrobiales bacterium TaxID=1645740 RepID=A0A6J4UUU5_9BACT|nr:MAG: Methylmalonyl-CoA mutase [uncultured Thermomicrobiales bacterium]
MRALHVTNIRSDITTDSGITVDPVYRAPVPPPHLPDPGTFPYTRGIYPTGYRGRRWTMRQYAGFSSAEESNRRYRLLLERGTTGLSVAFDLPTQLGLDADDGRAVGEVGRVGVSVSTLDDVRRLFDGIDQGKVTTSMTINAPASLLLLMYQIVAEERGVDASRLGGTIQNDILKEYAARGTYVFPPRPSMRLVTDTFAYCREHLPAWNTISVSGYHIREAGSSAAQEIAFSLANGLAYLDAATAAGLGVDDVAPRMSFFFAAHSRLFEEAAKFRAARRLWATLVRERYAPKDLRSETVRFHTQTGGVTLTAQQPLNNVVRVAYQALAAVLGGTQSLHTNGYDEALALPTAEAATLALRTQQILAEETGVADTADPLAGSYLIERLTDELEAAARMWLARVEERGGAVAAIETGFVQNAIAENAYRTELARERGEEIVVGVNIHATTETTAVPIQRIDEALVAQQVERVRAHKAGQNRAAVEHSLDRVTAAARGDAILLPVMKEALLAEATLGQIMDRLRAVFGEHRAGA